MRLAHPTCLILACAVALPAHATPPASPNRVTILYDAFGGRAGLTRDWGFAALVEYNGKRILFDTGNNADVFANNVRALGVDLRTIDFVVISHRHGDHTAGLNYLLTVNPGVRIRSEEHTSELQSQFHLVCRLLLEKKKNAKS